MERLFACLASESLGNCRCPGMWGCLLGMLFSFRLSAVLISRGVVSDSHTALGIGYSQLMADEVSCLSCPKPFAKVFDGLRLKLTL